MRIARRTLEVFADDERASEILRIERTRSGSYNRVFFLREYDDVVVRVSREKLDEESQRAYHAEIETQRLLARHDIAPRVFCVVRVVRVVTRPERPERPEKRSEERPERPERPSKRSSRPERPEKRTVRPVRSERPEERTEMTVRSVRLGCAMERFDLSLAEAIDRGADFCSNGWTREARRALVELFERAATLVRCVDTTASNVVVRRLAQDSEDGVDESEEGGAYDAVEFRLIDVDGHFCGRAASEPESVRDALRAWESGTVRASAGTYAALSLLVLCVHARLAWLARMLLKHEVGLVRVLADDAAAQTMVSARDRLVWTQAQVSAMEMVRAYATKKVRAPHDVPGVLRAIASEA